MYKIYGHRNEWLATCLHVEDAAALLAFLGAGYWLTDGIKKYVQGETGDASESYDEVAEFFEN